MFFILSAAFLIPVLLVTDIQFEINAYLRIFTNLSDHYALI